MLTSSSVLPSSTSTSLSLSINAWIKSAVNVFQISDRGVEYICIVSEKAENVFQISCEFEKAVASLSSIHHLSGVLVPRILLTLSPRPRPLSIPHCLSTTVMALSRECPPIAVQRTTFFLFPGLCPLGFSRLLFSRRSLKPGFFQCPLGHFSGCLWCPVARFLRPPPPTIAPSHQVRSGATTPSSDASTEPVVATGSRSYTLSLPPPHGFLSR
jgi:hypothetical protein